MSRGLRLCDPRDEALAAELIGRQRDPEVFSRGPDNEVSSRDVPLSDRLSALLTPWSDTEIEAARSPCPHVFATGERGIFPIGEVSVVGARGREGKTTILTAIAVAAALQQPLVGLVAPPTTTVIYSAEDDRQQYARKIGAQMSLLAPTRLDAIRNQIIVPDLDDESVASARALVAVLDRQPMPTGTVGAIIDALRPLLAWPVPLRLVIFETASALSDADEDNRGHKTLVAALKSVARALGVGVVLVHHTSQQADSDLADLNISTANIRGGTSLIYNGRQTWMLVNLGCDADPFPDTDARTILRQMVCDGSAVADLAGSRLLVMVCLDSSKSMAVPPIFFRWIETAFGPAAVGVPTPDALAERPWRKVHAAVRGARAGLQGAAKEQRKADSDERRGQDVLRAIARLEADGQPATANRIRDAVGASGERVRECLAGLKASGQLRETTAFLHGRERPVYRIVDTSSPSTGATSAAAQSGAIEATT